MYGNASTEYVGGAGIEDYWCGSCREFYVSEVLDATTADGCGSDGYGGLEWVRSWSG